MANSNIVELGPVEFEIALDQLHCLGLKIAYPLGIVASAVVQDNDFIIGILGKSIQRFDAGLDQLKFAHCRNNDANKRLRNKSAVYIANKPLALTLRADTRCGLAFG